MLSNGPRAKHVHTKHLIFYSGKSQENLLSYLGLIEWRMNLYIIIVDIFVCLFIWSSVSPPKSGFETPYISSSLNRRLFELLMHNELIVILQLCSMSEILFVCLIQGSQLVMSYLQKEVLKLPSKTIFSLNRRLVENSCIITPVSVWSLQLCAPFANFVCLFNPEFQSNSLYEWFSFFQAPCGITHAQSA